MALAVTGVVTYRAYEASRNYKNIVERVLNDYVAVAAYQLQQSTETAVNSCLMAWMHDVTDPSLDGKITPGDLAVCDNKGKDRFDYDIASGVVHAIDRPLAPSILAAIKHDAPQREGADFRYGWQLGVLVPRGLAADEFVAYGLKKENGKAVRVVGFVAKGVGQFIVDGILTSTSLLAPELAKGPTNELWTVQLASNQAPHPITPTAYYRRAGLRGAWEGLAIDIAMKPTAFRAIIPNGIPKDNGYQFIGLFVLALGLVTASVLLLRRESQLARARASFVSSVSHELRTPLAQIRMFAEMLLLGRARTEAEQRRSAEIIENEAKRLSHLVENVLQAARSERGTVHINPTDARLAPVVRDAAESFMGISEARRIEFRLELQENLMVSADADAVRHIVLNLLDNAAKYGPVGQRVVVGLALFEDAARLWVDDEGPGVPARERERVFQPFYRSQRDLHSSTAGSGIGLAIVRELAALHGGSAWIEDAPQNGARVVVEFPGAYVAVQQAAGDWAVA